MGLYSCDADCVCRAPVFWCFGGDVFGQDVSGWDLGVGVFCPANDSTGEVGCVAPWACIRHREWTLSGLEKWWIRRKGNTVWQQEPWGLLYALTSHGPRHWAWKLRTYSIGGAALTISSEDTIDHFYWPFSKSLIFIVSFHCDFITCDCQVRMCEEKRTSVDVALALAVVPPQRICSNLQERFQLLGAISR